MTKTFLAIGECMIELSGGNDGQSDDMWRMGFAGDTLNTAWYVRALLDPAAWHVGYFTRLGRDGFSARMIEFLRANGIGTERIGSDEARIPGLYVIETQDGERSFTYWRERSAARLLADDEQELSKAIGQADVVYCSGITLAILASDRRDFLIEQLGRATAAGKLTAFDPNIRPRLWPDGLAMKAALMAAAGASRIVLPSFEDERNAFGDASPEATAERYRGAGATEVVVKNGRDAATIAWEEKVAGVAASAVTEIVDTTGAGDSFNGGYLAARLAGAAPLEAAKAGHRLAGIVVGQPGALVAMEKVRAVLT